MGRPHKAQHTIPKTYLQAFTDADGNLWVADVNLKVFSRKPDQILTERDYFTVRFPTGGATLAIETKYLNSIEGTYANIYRGKISKKDILSNEEKAKMAIFVASMIERQSNSRDAMNKFFDDMKEKIKHLNALPDEAKKKYEGLIYDKKSPSISGDEILEMSKDVGSLHSSLLPETVADIAPIIYDMRWVFMVRPKDSDPFITSNNPTIMVRPEAENQIGRGRIGSLPGLAYKDVELTLPLSSDIALIAGWENEKVDGEYITIPSYLVDEINKRTRRQSKTILGSDKLMIERIVARTKEYHQPK